MTRSTAQTGAATSLPGAGPVLAAIAAAASSLAFFKTWGVFSMSLAGPGEMYLTGADLAREFKGPIPWVYVTPAAILIVLLVSAGRLIVTGPAVRLAYSVLLPLIAAMLLVWPAEAIANITRHFSQLQILGERTMRLTWWWWTYCVSLVLVMTSGIIDLGSMVRKHIKKRTQTATASQ